MPAWAPVAKKSGWPHLFPRLGQARVQPTQVSSYPPPLIRPALLAFLALAFLALGAFLISPHSPRADVGDLFSPGELADFRAFNRPRWLRALADQGVQAAFFAALVFGGLSRRLQKTCD